MTRAHEQTHGHGHAHGHPHDHGHHHGGLRGALREIFVPHTHDAADSVDDALEASGQGIRAVKVSLVVLLATTVLQLAVVAISGSVALLADTVHNFADALTAVPLWIAFVLGRRAATRRQPYGYGRAEDLAGLFIVLVVALSAVVAAWQSIDRLVSPQPIDHLGWVIAAGVIGFAGNEAVAIYRIRAGRRIGSAALVADGVHARTDGFTSLAVVLGGVGVLLGFPLADPIVGLAISAAILVLLWGTVRSVGARLMDRIDPDLVDRAEHALAHVDGVTAVREVRLRWVGHRLQGDAVVEASDRSLAEAAHLLAAADLELRAHLPNLEEMRVRAVPPVDTLA
ncbi:cation diffusion facilitator family transporter [Agromyces mangrovi Wang et al. 2018]|uniref:cation diffusion facilitator family transporter n=1 Tax=Agromyces mangrovi TaxID=1858653 RepID=UPI00257355B9|nr:cation diffusion facilitator family transporter [Agromyces mangrovi]BDZ65187.1 Co/Zn/Cd cation transporter [Agromyces mangrovi]